MKKSTLLNLALLIVAIFVFVGAQAQTNDGDWAGNPTLGKYQQSAAAPIALPGAVPYTDFVTVGKTMPFWVWPSVAYNPNWDYSAFAAVNYPTVAQIAPAATVLSSFAWRTGTGNSAANAQAALGAAAGTRNYVEVTASATAGDYTLIEVTETAPAPGSCPGTPVYFGFRAVGVPTLSITNAVSNTMGLTNVISAGCGDQTAIAITGTFNTANESAPYHINLGYNVFNATVDGTGNITLGAEITNAVGVPDVNGVGGADPSTAAPIIVNASPIVAAQDYTVENNLPTVYRFTYYNLNATVSRKSDYIAARTGNWVATDYANFTYYPTAPGAGTVYYIVALPTPQTGPIYHISNSFAY